MAVLNDLLQSIKGDYRVEFRTDGVQHCMDIRVSKDGMTKATTVPYEYLTDELSIVRVIREAIEEISEGLLGQ